MDDGGTVLHRGRRLHGGGETAVSAAALEPIGPHELAPLIADAHQLTDRERAITQLVALGLATEAIAARLHASP